MKRIFPIHLFCLSGVALALGACTSEVADGGNAPADGPVPISFQTPETRAAKDGFDAGDAFSVWGWYADDAAGTNFRQVFDAEKVTNGGGNLWSYDGTQYWIAGKTYDFYAVYPTDVNAQVSQKGTITIENFDASQTGADAVDLMTASATGMNGDSPQMVGLRFGHLLSRVNIMVQAEGSDAQISQARLSGIKTTGDYDSSNSSASWILDGTTSSFDLPSGGNYTATSVPSNLLGDMLVPPQPVRGFILSVAYSFAGTSAATKEITLPADVVSQWEAGQSYTYTLTLSSNYISFGIPVVNEWGEASGGIIIVD